MGLIVAEDAGVECSGLTVANGVDSSYVGVAEVLVLVVSGVVRQRAGGLGPQAGTWPPLNRYRRAESIV